MSLHKFGKVSIDLHRDVLVHRVNCMSNEYYNFIVLLLLLKFPFIHIQAFQL